MRQRFILVVACFILLNTNLDSSIKMSNVLYKINTSTIQNYNHTKWEVFVEALISVDSEGDAHAIGNTGDVGILQLTPVYVSEVNRILGKDEFKNGNRTNIEKSLKMFKILQNHYNPNKSIEKAIKLHNPGADISYHDKIIDKMKSIKRDKNYCYKFSKLLSYV